MRAADLLNETYHAVVGNPPYIRCGDPALRERYRERYVSASGNFGLGVPFTERLFQLAAPGGYVGEITSNAFMKREHGRALVERVLPTFDLTHVVDTSGAFIPGHGTPTVILFARNRPPTSGNVRAVLHKHGEPATPTDPSQGRVWTSIRAALGHGPAPAYGPLAGERIVRALAKPLRALAADLAAAHRLGRDEAVRVAGAWVVTALGARALEARRVLVTPLPWSAGLPAVADALWHQLPAGTDAWFDDEDANPALARPPTVAADAAIRGALDALAPPAGGDVFGRSGWATPDTDWLGDLHQLTDAATVARFAFCQTPRFVRDLINAYTLEPALAEFGVEGFRVLDPACGAGHFVLDAFWRLYRAWADPDDGPPEHTAPRCAELALEHVAGVDLNPAVVALARFRLLLAFCDAAGCRSLGSVPGDFGARLRVVAGDALLEGARRPSPPAWPAPVAPLPVAPANDLGPLFARVAGGTP